jgi:hypothetical protein
VLVVIADAFPARESDESPWDTAVEFCAAMDRYKRRARGGLRIVREGLGGPPVLHSQISAGGRNGHYAPRSVGRICSHIGGRLRNPFGLHHQ